MADACNSCNKNCNNSYAISCNKCLKWYHSKCVNVQVSKVNYFANELKNPNGDRWICDKCSKSEVKSMAQQNNARRNSSLNGGKEQQKQYTINDVMEKLIVMDQRYCDLLEKYEEQKKVNDELQEEIKTLKNQINKETNRRDQEALNNNIIIKGVPRKNRKEDVNRIVKDINELLQIQIENTKCIRLGNNTDKADPIKVCFANNSDKQTFMQANKIKKLTLTDLGYEGENKIIYVDHDLTKYNQHLYSEVRKYKRDNNYKYTWVSNGKIFMRKEENCKVHLIEDISDLKNLQEEETRKTN